MLTMKQLNTLFQFATGWLVFFPSMVSQNDHPAMTGSASANTEASASFMDWFKGKLKPESPMILNGKIYGFRLRFSRKFIQNQAIFGGNWG